MKQVDFIIVGQGLAGSVLAYELMQRGHSVLIIDPEKKDTSSLKAAGLYNPITGRSMVKTWLADTLWPAIVPLYTQLEKTLGTSFHHSLPIYRPFFSYEELNDWMGKEKDPMYAPYVQKVQPHSLGVPHFIDPCGGLELRQTGYVDLPKMIAAMRTYFREKGVYTQGQLTGEMVQANGMQYEGTHAKKVIFCEGPDAVQNPFWQKVKFRPVRGEVMDIRCELPPDRVYNRGVFMLPREGYFRVGSTYHHQPLVHEPQEKGLQELRDKLAKIFDGPYETVETRAGVRPATSDRKPVIGWHPENKAVGIFNGFGAKGVSLVPYFSKLFADSLEGRSNIQSEADVSRFF